MERQEIEERYLWDLSSAYASDEDFEVALEQAQSYPEQFAAYQGRVCESSATLLEFMQADDAADIVIGKLMNYASRKADEDTRVSKYQDYEDRVRTLVIALMGAYSWFEGELLAAGPQRIDELCTQEPALELYRRSFELVFRRAPHILSAPEEALLAGAREMAVAPGNVFDLLNDADLTFPDVLDSQGHPHEVTHGTYVPLMRSSDRVLRKNAYASLYGVYEGLRNTSAAVLGAQAKQLGFFARARKYGSALEAALYANEVPVEVYTNLVEAVHRNMPAMYRYVDLRKRLLGLDELHFYDLYTPMVEGFEMRFTYEEACETILAALEPMGEEYLEIVRQGLQGRWVDVYETPGKRSGAYSAGGYGMHPVILLNFQGTLDDVFTLIHEMGHSVHTYLSCKHQPSRYSDYVIFVAEVASTCNESLLMHYLLQKAQDPKEKAYLLDHFMEQFRATIYRQTMFAEFEMEVGEMCAQGAGITADALCEMYAQLNREYFGDGVQVDERIAMEWARIPHFYYNYYVYQYATGYAAAIALSERILHQGTPAVKDYLEFLSSGCSKPPIELLRGAGVDMASPQPIDSALRLFDQVITQMEELVDGGQL